MKKHKERMAKLKDLNEKIKEDMETSGLDKYTFIFTYDSESRSRTLQLHVDYDKLRIITFDSYDELIKFIDMSIRDKKEYIIENSI